MLLVPLRRVFFFFLTWSILCLVVIDSPSIVVNRHCPNLFFSRVPTLIFSGPKAPLIAPLGTPYPETIASPPLNNDPASTRPPSLNKIKLLPVKSRQKTLSFKELASDFFALLLKSSYCLFFSVNVETLLPPPVSLASGWRLIL